jgi:microsomal prostaglandin-E synthase 1
MTNLATQPTFVFYAASMIALGVNMLLLWAYSGSVRGKTRTTPNAEDAGTIARGAQLAEADPPEVARVLRAHRNATANIVPFAILGLVYVLAGGSAVVGAWVFGVFTAARIGHSFAYLAGKQPWRSLSYAIGAASTLALIGFLVRALIAANV